MAESQRDEIAKLEALHAERPKGHAFTHLAEAYRKAGELDRARELLAEGIERHDDYSSAHVVLGRVLRDQEQTGPAADEFRRVLELDPQNRVALRALGDLTRDGGDPEAALVHYRELLSLDPADEELEAVVAELESAREAEIEVVPSVEPVGPEIDTDLEPAGPELDTELEPTGEPPVEEVVIAEDAASDDLAIVEEVEPDDAAVAEDVGEDEEPLGTVDGFVGTTWDEPDAAEEPEPDDWLGEVESVEETDEVGADDISEPELDAGLEAEWALDDEEEEPTNGVATETAAELYARQGHYDRAAQVYHELLRERPGDPDLEAKLEEVEAQAAGERGAGLDVGAEADMADANEPETAGPLEPETTDALDWEPVGGGEEAAAADLEEIGADAEADPTPVDSEETWEDTDRTDAEPGGMESEDDETDQEVEALLTGAEGAAGGADATPYAWTDEVAEAGAEDAGGADHAGGASVSEYLGGLLAWRLSSLPEAAADEPAADVAAPSAEPEAADADESLPFIEPLEEPPVEESPEAPPEEPSNHEFDFLPADEPEPATAAGAPPAEPSETAESDAGREGEEDDEDLEMFRDWLESLKH